MIQIRALHAHELDRLAETLRESPETVLPLHWAREGRATAWGRWTDGRLGAFVLEGWDAPDEPFGFGDDPSEIAEVLVRRPPWGCVNVRSSLAHRLADGLRQVGWTVGRVYGDLYHTLLNPPPDAFGSDVRLLTDSDESMISVARSELPIAGFRSFADLCRRGWVAGATDRGRLVSLAQTSALGARFVDVGVATAEGYRCRGYATAAASLVVRAVIGNGRVPVWSAGEDNLASLRVAEKLGFREVSRRSYVIVDPSSRPNLDATRGRA